MRRGGSELARDVKIFDTSSKNRYIPPIQPRRRAMFKLIVCAFALAPASAFAPGEWPNSEDRGMATDETCRRPTFRRVQDAAPAKDQELASDRGALALNEYARANDPFAVVGREQVAVEVTSVIRASAKSFRVAWVERRYRDGALAETSRWTAILGITVQPPRDPDALTRNPLGIFVTSINWSKELG